MKATIKLPADLAPLSDNINLMDRMDRGLVDKVGFRATVDDELVEGFWDVGGSEKQAADVFETKVFPHLRVLFEEDLEELKDKRAAAALAAEKAAKRAERLAATSAPVAARPAASPDELVPDVGPVVEPKPVVIETVTPARKTGRSKKAAVQG